MDVDHIGINSAGVVINFQRSNGRVEMARGCAIGNLLTKSRTMEVNQNVCRTAHHVQSDPCSAQSWYPQISSLSMVRLSLNPTLNASNF